jgi:hypothetical protein
MMKWNVWMLISKRVVTSDIKADEDDEKKDNVVEEEVLGKGKRVRKLTPKTEKLRPHPHSAGF